MKVAIDGRQLTVSWQYSKEDKELREGPVTVDVTTALVKDDVTKEVVNCASVVRYFKDPYDKDLARRITLKNAIAALPRAQRGIFWNSYRNRNVATV